VILGKLNEVIVTGFIDLDEIGYFLTITDSKERIYFPEYATDIPELHQSKKVVRVAAIVEEGDNGFYKTDYWAFTPVD
jgi:hypothetical protein